MCWGGKRSCSSQFSCDVWMQVPLAVCSNAHQSQWPSAQLTHGRIGGGEFKILTFPHFVNPKQDFENIHSIHPPIGTVDIPLILCWFLLEWTSQTVGRFRETSDISFFAVWCSVLFALTTYTKRAIALFFPVVWTYWPNCYSATHWHGICTSYLFIYFLQRICTSMWMSRFLKMGLKSMW